MQQRRHRDTWPTSCVSSDSTRSAPPRVSEGITPRIFKLRLASPSGEIYSYVGRSRALTGCPLGHWT